jgi:hypothetical protein
MSWTFSAAIVHELVKAAKCPAPGQKVEFTSQGEHGKELSLVLELIDGAPHLLRLVVTAARAVSPETYEAALLLNNRRIRGLGFSKVASEKGI